jgi:hypothetical protein
VPRLSRGWKRSNARWSRNRTNHVWTGLSTLAPGKIRVSALRKRVSSASIRFNSPAGAFPATTTSGITI